ncbi:hypothetical protein [Pedobacter glucosidilyticus]|uniref:hypothetical protein n=1 Tax=Pedobacter glucosidilyticus TaxID=1122941 RepID=UPI0026F1B4BA|nr:hypothetical protein [Pedobacter glucosidilyticus]
MKQLIQLRPLFLLFISLIFSFDIAIAKKVTTSLEAASSKAHLSRKKVIHLKNEFIEIDFVQCLKEQKASYTPVIKVKTSLGWKKLETDPTAESYQIVSAGETSTMEISGFYPKWVKWVSPNETNITKKKTFTNTIWEAGKNYEPIISAVKQDGKNRVSLEFYRLDVGVFKAVWELFPNEKNIRVQLQFTPQNSGQYSLGYFAFNRKSLDEVEELLMPMTVQRKRFPTKTYTLLQAECPTPISLMQVSENKQSIIYGIAADSSEIPYEFPIPIKSRFGIHIRNSQGQVQPSIYGPLIGTTGSQKKSGETLTFSFRILTESGDWYSSYRNVCDEVFGWRDYRTNGEISLTNAAYNMIDLYMNDEYSGWWQRAKGFYQIESKNGATQASPLTAVSLYYLTGDTNLYKRRTLPTLEYFLSRSGPHFSPIPEDTGSGYPAGTMNGPPRYFGKSVYGDLEKMLNGRTLAFKSAALKASNVTTPYEGGHIQPFDDWLGRYLYNGDKHALDSAIKYADKYIDSAINKAPQKDLGINPFFLVSFVPNWEGLLRLYEVTKEKRFLDAAKKGAQLVMTGIWTQPMPPQRNTTIHPNGIVHGDKMDRELYKGSIKYRIGWPKREDDSPEKEVPAWLVSNAGLGFEAPTTYTYKSNGGRMISMSSWSGAFLRLALYTGDKQFETYARNAVLGRFGNYPGYYYTTFTDLMQDPNYPYKGPDVGFIYYHHLPVHLSWTIDYLVSEAKLRSKSKINFPGLRQFGYAFFDYLVYGNQPGDIMGIKDTWLWLRKGLVNVDNNQINYLTAHTDNKFFVILMNESSETQKTNITFFPSVISKSAQIFKSFKVMGENGENFALKNNSGQIEIKPRGLQVIEVDGLDIDVPLHKKQLGTIPSKLGTAELTTNNGMKVNAAAIQILPGSWSAYIWSNANSKSLNEISVSWTCGDKTGVLKDLEYPYEFSIEVPDKEKQFRFSVSGIDVNGSAFQTKEAVIGVVD